MYEQFLADPSSVDPAWHDFFADYKPTPRAASQGVATTKARSATDDGAVNGQLATATRPDPPAKAPPAPTRQAPPAATPPPAPAPAASNAPIVKISEGDQVRPIRGANAVIAKNMDLSLTIPTATSVR